MNKQEFFTSILKEHGETKNCASTKTVGIWFERLLSLIFPGFSESKLSTISQIENEYDALFKNLQIILRCSCDGDIAKISNEFFDELPLIKERLNKDTEAIFKGDPAAKSLNEITRAYPGFYAIAAHRIAHKLHKLGIELIPRIISEHAHTVTGIDIHPGAVIGDYFFIDHGTGVVIGETTVIGNWVKIYQGVTLGALSVVKSDQNNKRHPTVEDGVVIYAGATILGGETVIGKDSVVGGNVWLTRSVPPQSKVYYKAKMSNEEGEIDTITFKS